VTLSADGRLLASGGEDGTVRLWEAPAGRPLATLQDHTGPVYGVALSADGRLLASGGLDRTIRLWEAPFARLEGDQSFAGRSADSGDASGGWRLLATLRAHTRAVFGVATSGDGRLLVSGGLDGTVRLWDPSSGACLRLLRSDRRYERVDITGLTGVTAAQRAALLTLGAVDHEGTADETPAWPC